MWDPPSPDYVPGPEEPEQAPPSSYYIPFVPDSEMWLTLRKRRCVVLSWSGYVVGDEAESSAAGLLWRVYGSAVWDRLKSIRASRPEETDSVFRAAGKHDFRMDKRSICDGGVLWKYFSWVSGNGHWRLLVKISVYTVGFRVFGVSEVGLMLEVFCSMPACLGLVAGVLVEGFWSGWV
ncbi:hypothetical protein Tco_1448807 [Tanacetum coccineum]